MAALNDVLGHYLDLLRGAAGPDALRHVPPRHGVHGAIDLDVAVPVDSDGLPNDRVPPSLRKSRELARFLVVEHDLRSSLQRSMNACRRDLHKPPEKMCLRRGNVNLGQSGEEVVLDVLGVPLDLALLLWRSNRRRVDLEPVSTREFSIAPIENVVFVTAEGLLDDRGLQVVWNHDSRHAAEELERVDV